MINSLLLALSVSIDSLGIGITYGIKNTKIHLLSKFILIIISIAIVASSFFIGNIINTIFSTLITKILSSLILILLGIIIIIDPIPFDFDKSHELDIKETLILGFAISLDSLCVGISLSIGGLFSFFFPIFVATFQVIFLTFGILLGKKLIVKLKINDIYLKIISGIILIIFGLLKL